MSGRRPTLAQVFGATFVALALALGGLLWLFYASSRRTLLRAGDQLSAETGKRVSGAVAEHLAEAERLVAAFEAKVVNGLVRVDDPQGVLTALRGELAGHPHISALALTHGTTDGFYATDEPGHAAGDVRLRRAGRWQVSVARRPDGTTAVRTVRAGGGVDPTDEPTFVTPSRRDQAGRTLWSDLYLPPDSAGRRVVTVQKALWPTPDVVAVLRVSLLSERIDELVRVPLEERAGRRPLVFIADAHGHLVARLQPDDEIREIEGEEVRVRPARPSPALTAALARDGFAALEPGAIARDRFVVAGEPQLLTLVALPEGRTQGWIVGLLVPEVYFLEELRTSLHRGLLVAALLAAACLLAGALILRATRRDLGGLVRQTARLRRFDFAPAPLTRVAFRDVREAADSLEQAKTALRALGKYVPLELVRQLYEARAEPMLGGRLQEVSMLFTDIEGFTSLSEALPLDVLAPALGRYLEAMTRAIHGTRGIIDKYVGDGVMALWNAPSPCDGHAARACAATLACIEATGRLFASPAWGGLPPWRTRFGIHRAEVNVGHFGAPDRMSFTVMGDGVNLASRLESLNKQYGTQILVSAEVEREARGEFRFRRLDRVAVRGRHQGVEVYELRGRRGETPDSEPVIARYEEALDAYLDRRFDAALALLAGAGADPPSRVLAARCRHLRAQPPPSSWSGVHVAPEK